MIDVMAIVMAANIQDLREVVFGRDVSLFMLRSVVRHLDLGLLDEVGGTYTERLRKRCCGLVDVAVSVARRRRRVGRALLLLLFRPACMFGVTGKWPSMRSLVTSEMSDTAALPELFEPHRARNAVAPHIPVEADGTDNAADDHAGVHADAH